LDREGGQHQELLGVKYGPLTHSLEVCVDDFDCQLAAMLQALPAVEPRVGMDIREGG